MSKKYLFYAMATVALASCSQEETIEMSKGRTIDFRPTTEYMSRGTAIETAEAIGSFNVTALRATKGISETGINGYPTYTFGSPYFSNQIWKNNNGWTTDKPAFWPNEGELCFFAYSPAETTGTVTINSENQKLENFVPDSDIEKQVDLLVAAKIDAKKEQEVQLNFEHALSQIEVQAQVHNANYAINVKGVKLANISSKGTMDFPTKYNYTITEGDNVRVLTRKHTTTGTLGDPLEWSPGSEKTYYTVSGTSFTLTKESGKKSLMFDKGSFMLIPQTLQGYNSSNATEGAYIAVLCQVIRTSDNVQIYPYKSEGKYAYSMIPISTEWAPGKKYTYTLSFFNGDEGGAGQVDPNPGVGGDNDTEVDPKPEGGNGTGGEEIITGGAIKYSLNVSKWESGSTGVTNMQ